MFKVYDVYSLTLLLTHGYRTMSFIFLVPYNKSRLEDQFIFVCQNGDPIHETQVSRKLLCYCVTVQSR